MRKHETRKMLRRMQDRKRVTIAHSLSEIGAIPKDVSNRIIRIGEVKNV